MRDRYASLREGLVGAWIPSISGSGLLLPDLSGNGNNGTLTNMGPEDWVSGQYGRVLDFDGVDDYVDTAKQIQFERTDAFSLCAFVLSDGVNTQIINNENSSYRGYQLSVNASGYLNFLLRSATSGSNAIIVADTSLFSLGTLQHACVTYSGSSQASGVKLYVNGVLLQTTTTSDNLTSSTISNETTWFGRRRPPTNGNLSGQLDDIRIYNRALSEPEIKLLASRPGIGLRPQRRTMYYAPPTGARRRRILTSMP